jgi:miniconductance mechanosensitive channel
MWFRFKGEQMEYLAKLENWFQNYPTLFDFLAFTLIIIGSFIVYLTANKILIKIINKLAASTKTSLDDYIVQTKALQYFSFLLPLIIILNSAHYFPDFTAVISSICEILIIYFIIRTITSFLKGLNSFYETLPRSKERPIKGYIQVFNLFLYILAAVYLFAVLTGQSPWAVLSALGALTAVLLLVFKDTILSFVAGIQITSYDLIHVGDWISLPQYGADGEVTDIALHTVKIQNWDKTISIIPTYQFTANSYKNWRGMAESGGRRIKRSLNIDQNSIHFLTIEDIDKLKKIALIKPYLEQKTSELQSFNKANAPDSEDRINSRRLTNIGTFRAYAEAYIGAHPKIKKDLTRMVRQLSPTAAGIPLEIYAFTDTTEWLAYENIQADIFDQLLAVLNEFDLQVFQNPTGMDFRELKR